jgi:hypothetical protein
VDEIDRIRAAATMSIGRACLFGLLAIGTVMSGLISWPVLAFKSGAILTSLLTAILMLRAGLAHRQNFRRTETWVLLDKRHDLPADRAQGVFAGVLRETYRRFALYAAGAACLCWALAFMFLLTAPQAPRTFV